jgi:hypothetical protein
MILKIFPPKEFFTENAVSFASIDPEIGFQEKCPFNNDENQARLEDDENED